MDIRALNFNEEIEQAILSMSLKVELSENKRIRATKSLENLVLLVKVAKNSHAREVVDSLVNFVEHLNAKQLSFFTSIGVNLTSKKKSGDNVFISYRGAHVKRNNGHDKVFHTEKKRIVYRGTESWI